LDLAGAFIHRKQKAPRSFEARDATQWVARKAEMIG
jgi:hypothetical protein